MMVRCLGPGGLIWGIPATTTPAQTLPDQLYYEDIREGMAIPKLEKRPGLRELVMYAGASEDYYEVHYDTDFARSEGLPDAIVHGALKSGFLGQLLTDWIGDQGRLRKLEVQYRGMDIHGEPIYCMGKVTRKYEEGGDYFVECEIWTENASGVKTSPGTALVTLPSRSV